MKIDVLTITGEKKGTIDLPSFFDKEIRLDLIKKAYVSEQSYLRPSYGAFPLAGKLVAASGKVKHARDGYKHHYGQGISRVPRKIISRRGERINWVGAFAPGTRGGRAAHPPKSWKNFEKRINNKEKKLALYSAISAVKTLVIEDKFEGLKKTKEIKAILEKINSGKILIITKEELSTKNLNADLITVKNLSVSNLAPSGRPRKIVLWTESAIKELK